MFSRCPTQSVLARFAGVATCIVAASVYLFSQNQGGTTGLIPYPRPTPTTGAAADETVNATVRPGENYVTVRVVGANLSVPDTNFLHGLFRKAKYVTMTSSATATLA